MQWPPFDPTETGPGDILAAGYNKVARFIDENSRIVLISSAVLILGSWHYGISIPSAPQWLEVGILFSLPALVGARIIGSRLAKWLWEPDNVLLSELSAESGDQDLLMISPDRFDHLTVINHNGQRRERAFLHEVWINGRRAYEVDSYHAETNHAVASWQAGASNVEMRQERTRIKRIKTTLEKESDKALELLANHPDILREGVREVANHIVKVAEDVETGGGGDLHETLADTLEDNDPSEDLLDGTIATRNGSDEQEDDAVEIDLDDDDPMQDVFDRAREMMDQEDDDHA